MSKGFRIGSFLFTIFSILTLLLTAFVIASVAFGVRAYSVVSDSMAPTFYRGDIVLVKSVPFSELQVGDIVTVNYPRNDGRFTHRIYSIDTQHEEIYTMGDNNGDIVDPTSSPASRIDGKMIAHIPYLGYLSLQASPQVLTITLLVIAIILVIASMILRKQRIKMVRKDESYGKK